MALDLRSVYPGQIADGDPDYPFGNAQNEIIEGDGSGTPLEARLLNESIGFQQALLIAAELTPNGTPERASASQYLDAIQALIAAQTDPIRSTLSGVTATLQVLQAFGAYSIGSTITNNGQRFALASVKERSGFLNLGGGYIRVGSPGWYLALAYLQLSDNEDSGQVGATLRNESTVLGLANSRCGQFGTVMMMGIASITDPASQRFNVTANYEQSVCSSGMLAILQLL